MLHIYFPQTISLQQFVPFPPFYKQVPVSNQIPTTGLLLRVSNKQVSTMENGFAYSSNMYEIVTKLRLIQTKKPITIANHKLIKLETLR